MTLRHAQNSRNAKMCTCSHAIRVRAPSTRRMAVCNHARQAQNDSRTNLRQTNVPGCRPDTVSRQGFSMKRNEYKNRKCATCSVQRHPLNTGCAVPSAAEVPDKVALSDKSCCARYCLDRTGRAPGLAATPGKRPSRPRSEHCRMAAKPVETRRQRAS